MVQKKAIIIGAGMAGAFMSVVLAKRGFEVDVYESRPDVRLEPYDSGRSFNLTLYYRGILAMKKTGMWDEVKKIATVAEGNAAHYGEHKIVYDPFDAQGDEILYTVHRNHMNSALLNAASEHKNITFHFNTTCLGVDAKDKTVTLQKDREKGIFKVRADVVIGADGVNSIVRAGLYPDQKDTAVKEYEAWGYKEVHISADLTKHMKLRLQATHTWPRPDSLLIAFPNPDDTFTLMFNLPLEGKKSFATLTTDDTISDFITHDFPDLLPLLPEIIAAFKTKPTGTFVTLYSKIWHDDAFTVLIGDAAHAVIPFYGQGMCAAYEDCLKLGELIDEYGDDWERIFMLYQENRKKNTDILAELSKENFIELRDKSRSPFHIFQDKADTLLHRIMPKAWSPPLYVLVAHTSLEYDDAINRYTKQRALSKRIGLDLALRVLSTPWVISSKFKTE